MLYIQKYKIVVNFGCIALLSTMLTFSSCKKFLDEKPSKTSSLVVTTTTQLNALLDNYRTFYIENNRTAINSTDDYGLNLNLYNASPGTFKLPLIQFFLWDSQYIPNDNTERLWNGEYQKIFNANLVLDQVDKVSGSKEDKDNLKADAHFIRAYSYWVLANTYCLPYTEASKNEMGLPLKVSTSFEESVKRVPLYQVYELIESDLAEALKTKVSLTQGTLHRNWRANIAAVNGFAARYYLNRNNYAEALKYANNALAEHHELVDYNTEMRYGQDQKVSIDGGTPNQKDVVIKYPYTHDSQVDLTDLIGWKELLYFRVLEERGWWFVPSQSLIDLYDQDHDLRYKYHVVQNYSYDRGLIKPSYSYPGYIFFFKSKLLSGPTVAEMLLTKAEAQARLNDPQAAMTTLNTLRAKRITPGNWLNLTASDRDDAIKKIADERRREMPYTQRWFDIRRYNNNDDPKDNILMTRTFYPYSVSSVLSSQPAKTYTLPINSRRFAAPIPNTEIISSDGAIQQNSY